MSTYFYKSVTMWDPSTNWTIAPSAIVCWAAKLAANHKNVQTVRKVCVPTHRSLVFANVNRAPTIMLCAKLARHVFPRIPGAMVSKIVRTMSGNAKRNRQRLSQRLKRK